MTKPTSSSAEARPETKLSEYLTTLHKVEKATKDSVAGWTFTDEWWESVIARVKALEAATLSKPSDSNKALLTIAKEIEDIAKGFDPDALMIAGASARA